MKEISIEKIASEMLESDLGFMKEIETTKNYDQFYKKIIESEMLNNQTEIDYIAKALFNHMFGYGILQDLIEDEEISDINITRYDNIIFKKRGNHYKSDVQFRNVNEFLSYCKLIILRNGGKLNSTHNHDRVDDHERLLRISASIPPRSSLGPNLSIRKHKKNSYTFDDLMSVEMVDKHVVDLIKDIVEREKNILICGRGGAGKTTLLRSILDYIPNDKRFLVCESENELYPKSDNFIVEKIVVNEYGKNVNLSDLIRDGLTLSLDGYCIGEIVGPEAWEFIMAGLTDHITFGTIHASGYKEVIPRLKMLINSKIIGNEDNEIKSIIGRSLDYIIYMRKYKVVEIALIEDKKWKVVYRRENHEQF